MKHIFPHLDLSLYLRHFFLSSFLFSLFLSYRRQFRSRSKTRFIFNYLKWFLIACDSTTFLHLDSYRCNDDELLRHNANGTNLKGSKKKETRYRILISLDRYIEMYQMQTIASFLLVFSRKIKLDSRDADCNLR